MTDVIVRVFEFEGARLTAYMFRGRPCWLAQDIGAALGYTAKGFQNAVREWSDELVEGQDIQTLRGAELREFKALAAATTETVAAKITQLTVLFEPGVYVVSLKTEKPLGKKLRRFLADKVMTAIRRGTLNESEAQRELIKAMLQLNPAPDQMTIWELDVIQDLCRLYRKPWDGLGSWPAWLKEPLGRIYRLVLGEVVYRELKNRNPEPRDGSLNYQFLSEAKHKHMAQKDMMVVASHAKTARTRGEFFANLRHIYRGTPLQLVIR
jgi:prophage antirepressor-like protein